MALLSCQWLASSSTLCPMKAFLDFTVALPPISSKSFLLLASLMWFMSIWRKHWEWDLKLRQNQSEKERENLYWKEDDETSEPCKKSLREAQRTPREQNKEDIVNEWPTNLYIVLNHIPTAIYTLIGWKDIFGLRLCSECFSVTGSLEISGLLYYIYLSAKMNTIE